MAQKKRPRGRPPVDSEAVQVRMLRADLAKLDRWIRKHMPGASRPRAIREIVTSRLMETR